MGAVTRHSRSPAENNYDDVASKKAAKRAQLKTLLFNKFKNKYYPLLQGCPEKPKLEQFLITKITSELETMFTKN